MIKLTLKDQPNVPLEAEVISPDVMASLSHASLCALPVFLGKRQLRLDEMFEVEGEAGETIEVHGDARKVKWIGRGMTRGNLKIIGNAGMHLGATMHGGRIDVSGNATDWIGAEMTGGTITVAGNAGGQIGAAYRGSLQGMRGGTIYVGGSAGLEVGMRMRRGLIVLGGPARDFTGLQMKGGTIFLLSGAELRTGAWMNRGTIISLKPLPLLPTFHRGADGHPNFLRLFQKPLSALGVSLPLEGSRGAYRHYWGDSSVPGKGEILVWQPR